MKEECHGFSKEEEEHIMKEFQQITYVLSVEAHNIKLMFDEAMQGKFCNYDEFKEMETDFWRAILECKIHPDYFHRENIDETYIKSRLRSFEKKYKVAIQHSIYEMIDYARYIEGKKKEDLTQEEVNDYEEIINDVEIVRSQAKKLGYEACEDYVEACLIYHIFAKNLYCYFKNNAISINNVKPYIVEALRFRQIAKNDFEVSPEEKLQFEKEDKEEKINDLLKRLSNEKAKAGWKYLLKKEVVIYNIKSGHLELSKEYMGKGKGGQEMLAFIGSYLANRFELKSRQDHGWNLEKVIEYDCTNKKDVCDMIGKLFGFEMKNKVKKPLEDGRRKGTNNGFVSPAKSDEVYEMLREFEKEYESKNK